MWLLPLCVVFLMSPAPIPRVAAGPKIFLNDSLVTDRPLVSGGHYFISLEDLARVLGATMSTTTTPTGRKTIALAFTTGTPLEGPRKVPSMG